ncbi:capsular biosynthesis protein [Pikeienuella sp. HZG-20]|uniref:capsular polysaccharide export protein, LipB/KpsS family n=1 Tax=Paludibacillus litoralis TaxID=3133267 RepID=UPI0030EDFF55
MTHARIAGEGRVFLLLQGPMSFFFTYLGAALRARGASVHRVLLCPGDRLFWRGPNAIPFRGRPEAWPAWLNTVIGEKGVTDIACLGDGRRWHEEALLVARARKVRVHVVEQGYLRPHWLTVEPDGTGGRSRFPRDWPRIEALAGPAVAQPKYRSRFAGYAAMDVVFNLANIFTSWALYPHFRIHTLVHPAREWAGWIRNKILPVRRRASARRRAEARIAAHEGPLFVLPLQLDTDYQIRLHAPPGGVGALLRRAILSFAAHAPDDALLVVKIHPLDHGSTDWRAAMERAAQDAGAPGRCLFLDGGDLGGLLHRAAGVIVANSTVGLTALQAGAPVIALGRAIYDLPDLTFQGGLDRFWREATPATPARLETFIRALVAAIQVPGGFDGTGARPGAAAMAARMLAPPPWESHE